jgi:hypothetical protein
MSVKQITTGQDSFLDIVANLVGILIILVVVIGAQASSVWSEPEPKVELLEQIENLEEQVSRTSNVVAKLNTDNEQLEERILEENRLAANLTDQRHEMLVQLEILRREIEKKRLRRQSELELIDANQRENIKRQTEFTRNRNQRLRELDSVVRETNAVAASAPKKDVIEHFPNPIAKTVFAEEVHFRLYDGKLSYVPMEELISRMKSEWKLKAEKLKNANRTVETVGPIKNFRMQYELATDLMTQQTKYGPVERKAVRFNKFQIHPVPGELGEVVEDALAEGSEFRQILDRLEPRRTTVSIWVYPADFGGHNEIKSWLHENGFQIASWPLENGRKISGGPQGFKTSAQ